MFTKLSDVQAAIDAKRVAGTLIVGAGAAIRLNAAIEVLQGFLQHVIA
jgi:hypothetical protein